MFGGGVFAVIVNAFHVCRQAGLSFSPFSLSFPCIYFSFVFFFSHSLIWARLIVVANMCNVGYDFLI